MRTIASPRTARHGPSSSAARGRAAPLAGAPATPRCRPYSPRSRAQARDPRPPRRRRARLPAPRRPARPRPHPPGWPRWRRQIVILVAAAAAAAAAGWRRRRARAQRDQRAGLRNGCVNHLHIFMPAAVRASLHSACLGWCDPIPNPDAGSNTCWAAPAAARQPSQSQGRRGAGCACTHTRSQQEPC